MVRIKILIAALVILFISSNTYGQELNCRITVNHQQIQGTNKQVFQSLQQSIYEFMNNRIWTNHVYAPQERIECNVMINITEQISVDEFKGSIQVQSNRPVYNTSYNTTMLNYQDNNFQFKYIEYQPLDFNENTHLSNLTSVLAFYAYVIIGLDYDSYSMEGGNPYFQKAEKIVSNAQNAPEKGWKAFESMKNRYWMIENLTNDRFSPVRECMYKYHRQGMDVLAEKTPQGRAVIFESIELLKKVHRVKPGSFLLQLFFGAKSDEIVKIFSEAYPDEKARIVQTLKEIDIANSSKYDKIMKDKP